jgi:hypothetical protein
VLGIKPPHGSRRELVARRLVLALLDRFSG